MKWDPKQKTMKWDPKHETIEKNRCDPNRKVVSSIQATRWDTK